MSSQILTTLMKHAIENVSEAQLCLSIMLMHTLIVFGQTGSSAMRSDIATMLNHLKKCSHQPESVRVWATQEHKAKYTRPSRPSSSATSAPPSTFLHPSTSYQPIQGSPALSFQQFPSPSPPVFGLQLSPLDAYNPSPIINAPLPLPQLPEISTLGFPMHGSPNISPNPLSRPSSSLASYSQGPPISRTQS